MEISNYKDRLIIASPSLRMKNHALKERGRVKRPAFKFRSQSYLWIGRN